MENITLGQVYYSLVFIIGIIGAVITICKYVKKILDKSMQPVRDELREEIIQRLRANLVNYQCLIDKQSITDIQKQNYFEQLDLYTNKYQQNSYVHQEHDRLKKAGKI